MKQIVPINEFVYGDSRILVYQANKNEGLPKHTHNVSHAVFCLKGSCLVTKHNVERVMKLGTEPLNLRANEWHEIEALEDETIFLNVFSEGQI